ncbi:MAG: diacylglycerol kinase family protein [Oscillospiraceae bacterium]|nr:diacylglycerol kinase family protein [Oscillospiraceae bacterium]
MSRHSAYNLKKSFTFAFSGIFRSLRHERNLRIHFFAAAYILYFSRYFELSKAEYAVLVTAIGGVIVCELMNTAIEAAVDLNTLAYNAFAKTAKDAAAGAVLVSSAISVAIGFLFFSRPDILREIWQDITSAPFIWIFLMAITIFLIAWPEYHRSANENSKE